MRAPQRQKRQGQKLHKVRHLQEQVAHASVRSAQQNVDVCQQAVANRKEALQQMERSFNAQARHGVSAQTFMRHQQMRALHTDAVIMAQKNEHRAQIEAKERQHDWDQAVHQRRVAERYLELAQERWAEASRRNEQKRTDDANCARAAR